MITAIIFISASNKDKEEETEVIVKKSTKPKKEHSAVAYGIGYGGGFLIYITLFIYGSMVMRGVMEEKTNRIAEVIVSSVKPFQLMIGKIVGIGRRPHAIFYVGDFGDRLQLSDKFVYST